MKDAKANSSAERRERFETWIALAAVFTAFSIFFYKSLFLGKPVAKLANIELIDALFNPALKQAVIDIGRDPSGYLIFFPNGHFEDSMWSRLVAPLWNPLSACGYPLFGDPQSFIHSPAHLLRLFSTPEAYQLGLMIEVAIGCAGMVLLARFYKLSIAASVLAALAFVFSPRILVQVDIAGNECFFPWVFLGFAWLAQKPSALRAALVGILCAFTAFAAHPETCFFAVLFAAILALFTMIFAGIDKSQAAKDALIELIRNGIKAIGYLLITAVVSLCIASPLALPFLEFMRNAYIYKDASGFLAPMTYQHLVTGLYANDGLEPLFIGAVAALLAPLGLLWKRQFSLPFLFTLLFAMTICLPIGPIMQVLSTKPIAYIATLYGIPDILLMVSILAGMGLDLIFERFTLTRAILLLLSAVIVIAYPVQYLQQSTGIHDLHQLWRSNNNVLTATTLIGSIAFIVCLCSIWTWEHAPRGTRSSLRSSTGPSRAHCHPGGFSTPPEHNDKVKLTAATALAVVLAVLNFASLALVDKKILPTNPKFSLNPPAPIAFLQNVKGRSVSTGTNLFLPNTNLDFGLEDFRCFSPLLPIRYHRFLLEAGGLCYNLYFYVLPDRASKLLDLASVNWVMTRSAMRSDEIDDDQLVDLGTPKVKRPVPGFRIINAKLQYDQINSQIDADMKFRVHDLCNYRYALQYCVFDSDGKELWSTRELMLSPANGVEHTSEVHESWPIPLNAHLPVSAGLRVKDTWLLQFVAPDNEVPHIGNAFLLCTANPGPKIAASERHFKLAKEFPVQCIRIYQNTHSFPPAYLLQNARHIHLNDEETIWQALKSNSFNARTEVIVEDLPEVAGNKSENNSNSDNPDLKKTKAANNELHALTIKRPDCNTVIADCEAAEDSWFVLTDSYYPGWKCFVDGHETPIYPANYLFRAVRLSSGKHNVRFSFLPASYYNSVLVAMLTILLVTVFALLRGKQLMGRKEAV